MATSTEEPRLQGIGQLLVLEKLLDKDKALEYQQNANTDKMPLLQYLVSKDILSALKIASSVARNFGIPLLDLDGIDTDSIPASLVSEKLLRRHNMLI